MRQYPDRRAFKRDMPVQHPLPSSPSVFLRDWRAWLPVPEDASSFDDSRIIESDTPQAANVPAMLRRRLTPLGRAICEMLDMINAGKDNLPIIHASQHGDGHRPLDMLDTIAAGDALSPTRFSLSVHNAILGIYSIAAGHHASMAALAAGGEEFEGLLHETRGYFAEGIDEVAVVLSDSPLPERYRAQAVSATVPSAIVMRLSRHEGLPIVAEPDPTREQGATRITPRHLVDWLSGGEALHTRRPALRWTITSCAHATAADTAQRDTR
ncbi:beta-ketoacyl synthase chain length factor [Phytohalomonas tamaricis]|uniref:beta-ketoacyl synthase chain length factor n=1 Tax=Phytohalomonas tamaricis TaxID=2081032 RepID=UPI001319D37F|nr:beta-ketoacyl synthase chain length factor [Phytohalomonas tamaricis]